MKNMKRSKLWLATALLVMGMMTGCGTEENNTTTENTTEANDAGAAIAEGTLLKDMDVDAYVTLGEYKGLAVEIAGITVDAEEANALANQAYLTAVTAENGGVKDRAVIEGDTVVMDYVGKRDGVAFDGGTAQNAELTIGSDSYIDGFEDGLIGVMPGETVDLNLTFPENYGNADLAGADVVFTVTLHYIKPAEMTEDSVAAALGIEGVETVDGLIAYANDYLYSQAESQYNSNVQYAVLDVFMNNCTFAELPQAMVEEYRALIADNVTAEALSYSNYVGVSIDAETYVQQAYGYESLEQFAEEYSVETVKQSLAMQALANRENLNLDDATLESRLLEYAQQSGYETIEEFIGDTPKEDFREYFMNQDVMAFLVENAVVTEPAAE